MDIQVDARNLSCPMPVVKTKTALESIDTGNVHVLIERSEGCQNIKRFAENQGCDVHVEEKEGIFHIHIEKGKEMRDGLKDQIGDVVLITTDVLGTGDRKLGEILMKAFLNTLWDTSPRPGKILFLNDGVRLTTEGSDVLDVLDLLEKEGVEIFSCGTCLEYYGLTDYLKIGKTTNMYDTVGTLLSAGKIIKI